MAVTEIFDVRTTTRLETIDITSLVPSDPDKVEHLCAEPSWLHRE